MDPLLQEMIERLDHYKEGICKCPFCGREESLSRALDYHSGEGEHPAYCVHCLKRYTAYLTTKIWCQTSKPTPNEEN